LRVKYGPSVCEGVSSSSSAQDGVGARAAAPAGDALAAAADDDGCDVLAVAGSELPAVDDTDAVPLA
jgi:hypothetical protein